MIVTTWEDWQNWSLDTKYSMLPYVIKIGLAEDRVRSWKRAWELASPNSFVLESGKGGRYTFFGLHPVSLIEGNAQAADVTWFDANGHAAHSRMEGSPLQIVKEWMSPYISPVVADTPKFLGGCVGFWGYDVVRTIEKLPRQAAADIPVPDYCFAMYRQVWILDHEEKTLYLTVHVPIEVPTGEHRDSWLRARYEDAQRQAEKMLRKWHDLRSVNWEVNDSQAVERTASVKDAAFDSSGGELASIEGIIPAFGRDDFIQAVRRIQQYISQGDAFQVNLSVRQSRKLEATPEEIYESLRIVNPSPYMGLLRFENFALVSGSPELLVQLEGGKLRTRPIAGTRPRGADAKEDRMLADELIHNEKERAEHVMLVDLERNDLGRISKYGSVRVQDFMVIEYYSHVMHIVSEVTGELAQGKDAYDVIAATFPGGTITGAPKIRTMEIIEELEPVRRGPYTGSMGWIDYNGNMEFNIIIRTLVAVEGIGHIQAGAGIVIDSVPEKEYMESLNKAKALWKAIQHSEQRLSRI